MNRTYRSLPRFTKDTGYEAHGVWGLGYDIFMRASAGAFSRRKYDRSKDVAANAVNLRSFDLRLRKGARAIDAGVCLPTLTDGFTGQAPDLGAIEFGSPPPHYGPRP